jgi:SAM-dependent methyltransferase
MPEPFREPAPFADASFDVVVMLATLEHIPDKAPLARECYRLLRPGGRAIVTVPSLWVDLAVALLCRLRLADGMSLEEHHGFEPRDTQPLFVGQGFALECWQRFQMGLNHLFVFRKPLGPPVRTPQVGAATDLACPCRAD